MVSKSKILFNDSPAQLPDDRDRSRKLLGTTRFKLLTCRNKNTECEQDVDPMWIRCGPNVDRMWTENGPDVDRMWTGCGLVWTETGEIYKESLHQ